MTFYVQSLSKCFFAVVILISAEAHAETAVISKAAESLIEHGARTALKECNLVANKCGASSFDVVDQGAGESNDEKRTWRTMKLNGLEVTAIFPVSSPKSYYLEKVVITTSRWPIPNGLVIGAPRKLLVDTIGSSSSIDADGCSVYFSEKQQSDVVFCFVSDRIDKVTWSWFID